MFILHAKNIKLTSNENEYENASPSLIKVLKLPGWHTSNWGRSNRKLL
jgi:hypothetical protein